MKDETTLKGDLQITKIDLLVSIPTLLYDDWLFSDFGEFQEKNRTDISASVCVDLSDCQFASPLPILAIITELMTHSDSQRIIIVDLGREEKLLQWEDRARTRKYLLLHGFFNAFMSRVDLDVRFRFEVTTDRGKQSPWFSNSEMGDGWFECLRAAIEKSPINLLYGTSIVLPATALLLPSGESEKVSSAVREEVEKRLRTADQALFKFKTEARKLRDTTLHRITQVLLELVENAAEHAYLGFDQGYVGLYARVRLPSLEGTGATWRTKEFLNSPLLKEVLRSDGLHQVELFVLDVGRGLLADLHKWEGCKRFAKSKHPLQALLGTLFFEPISRHSRKVSTVAVHRGRSTGLMHLNEILQREHDASRILTAYEMVAGAHPRDPDFHSSAASSGHWKPAKKTIYGTIFHIGLKPAEIPKLGSPWFESDDPNGESVRFAVLEKLTSGSISTPGKVVDFRHGKGFDPLRNEVRDAASAAERTLIRLGRVTPKNHIYEILTTWCDSFSQNQSSTSLLYLCDLGRTQAVDAVWIISHWNPKLDKVPTGEFKAAIYIVTEDLCCVQLTVGFKRYRGDSGRIDLKIHQVSTERLPDGLAYVAWVLRSHDSQRLWQRVHELRQLNTMPILVPNVLWTSATGTSFVLPWYLDFATLLQDREAARYVRRGLRRILSLFPDANDQALDPMVEAPLHDAKKWLVRPVISTKNQVLVGSLSVSGSTLSGYRTPPDVAIVGVIDCIETPYLKRSEPSSFPHVAALLWDSNLEHVTSHTADYRRIGLTSHIESVNALPPNPDIDADLYRILETNHLVKIGHWTYGDRHSLIDINAQLAIEQSAASATGILNSLADKLVELQTHSKVCLAYPFSSRLAYRLAHSVLAVLPEAMQSKITLLPLTFFQRYAGGLTKFTPMTTDAAHEIAKTWSIEQPIAVFLDIGFVTNRTLRHAVRQLKACGFREVRAMGILNRSSIPAPDVESGRPWDTNGAIPWSCWRWHLPIFGSGGHCALCVALPFIARLRDVVLAAHADLWPQVVCMADDWRTRDVADFWEEHGVTPKALGPRQIDSLGALFAGKGGVAPKTSTTLVARSIELIRLNGDIELPLKIADKLFTNDNETIIELLSCVLMLVGGAFNAGERQGYVIALARGVIGIDGDRAYGGPHSRTTRLLELAALTFAIQDSACRLAILTELVTLLSDREVHDPSVRIALITLTIDADGSSRVQDEFKSLCTRPGAPSALVANYHGLRPKRANVPETWDKLVRVFGRSSSHSQMSELGVLRSKLRNGTSDWTNALPQIAGITNLLAQCPHEFAINALGINLGEIVINLREIAEEALVSNAIPTQVCERLDTILGPPAAEIHSVLIRIGHGAESPNVWMIFESIFSEEAKRQGFSTATDFIPIIACRELTWPQDKNGYVPLCRAFRRLIKDFLENVVKWGIPSLPPTEEIFNGLPEKEARVWWWIDGSPDTLCEGFTLVFVNGVPTDNQTRNYNPGLGYLSDSFFSIDSRQYQTCGRSYFEIRIVIPTLNRILQESK